MYVCMYVCIYIYIYIYIYNIYPRRRPLETSAPAAPDVQVDCRLSRGRYIDSSTYLSIYLSTYIYIYIYIYTIC